MSDRLRRLGGLLGLTASFLLCAAALGWAAVDAASAAQKSNARTFDELVGLGALVGAWMAACWLTLGFLIVTAATIAGVAGGGRAVGGVGGVLDRVARRVAPRPLHRLARLAVGASVVTWGVVPAGGALAQTAPALPELDRPASSTTISDTVISDTVTSPAATSGPQTSPQSTTDRTDPVIVRRGDTLWDIAAARLGLDPTNAEIATAWPRWYAQNEQTIGVDPDLIFPGQPLTPPA